MIEDRIAAIISRCKYDPLAWSLAAWDWGVGHLAGYDGPRQWQREVLAEIRDALADPVKRHEPIMISRASGHGIGKSAIVGMVSSWALSAFPGAKIVGTANTERQLVTKTGPEVRRWVKAGLTGDYFDYAATSVTANARHGGDARFDLIPWSVNNTEAFAGLHNKGSIIVLVFDEASGIHDNVWEVAEGALTDEDTIIIWLVLGNPTRNSGRFRECFRRFRHRWSHKQIDSRGVEGTNKKLFAKWADDYGEDSDFFKKRVRGIFPDSGDNQFISTADVDAARGRHLRKEQYDFAAGIIGVDPAWTGSDEFVIYYRKGLMSKRLAVFPKNDDDVQMAAHIARFEDELQADAVIIDFGHGTGIISAGKAMGRKWNGVWFSAKPIKPEYLNKRVEMWGEMRDWLKSGGAIEDDEILYQDLIGPELVGRLDGKYQLESKEGMKERGLPSPNRADALALTFAMPVRAKALAGFAHQPRDAGFDDPLQGF